MQLGNFFTSLKLVDAFREYDSVFALSRRKYIPPNFAELRHVVNIAQASAPSSGSCSELLHASHSRADTPPAWVRLLLRRSMPQRMP